MDHISPLLHRVTGAAYSELNRVIAELSSAQFARLDALAAEIIDDTRSIALAGRRGNS